jgi:hypothetical protein
MRKLLRLVVVTALFTGLGAGCQFDFSRGADLQPGDVAGRAVIDGQAAPFARVHADGRGALVTADSDGRFVLRDTPVGRWSLRVALDADADGLPERAARRAYAVSLQQHADGLFGDGEPKATWVQLGDIELEPVVSLVGRVVDELGAPAPGARVFAFPRATLPAASSSGAELSGIDVDGALEANAGADRDGSYGFDALAAGTLRLFATREVDGDVERSEAVEVTASPGATLTPDDVPAIVLDSAGATARDVQIELAPTPAEDDRVKIVAVPAGGRLDADAFASFDSGDVLPGGASSLSYRSAIGAFDVHVRSEAGLAAVLDGRVADLEGDPVLIWGTARLFGPEDDGATELTACFGLSPAADPERDCDGDGLPALPTLDVDALLADPDLAVWRDCANTCLLAGASCTVEGAERDCDDDGDGQPDVAEPYACTALGAGDDRDGDGLCAVNDPFPRCAENDPAAAACASDAPWPSEPPSVRIEYSDFACTTSGAPVSLSVLNDRGVGNVEVVYFDEPDCAPVAITQLQPGFGRQVEAAVGQRFAIRLLPARTVLHEWTVEQDGDLVFFATGDANPGQCSRIDGTVEPFTIVNDDDDPVYLIWVDYRCGQFLVETIEPYSSHTEDSVIGNVWRVYDTDMPAGEIPLLDFRLEDDGPRTFTIPETLIDAGPDAGPDGGLDAGPSADAGDAGGDGGSDAGVTDDSWIWLRADRAEIEAVTADGARMFVAGRNYGANGDFIGLPGSSCPIANGWAVFVAELDDTGACLWLREIQHPAGSAGANGEVRASARGGVLAVTTWFEGTDTVLDGAGSPVATVTAPGGGDGAWVATWSYDGSFGNILHATTATRLDVDPGYVESLGDGTVVVAISHQSALTIAPGVDDVVVPVTTQSSTLVHVNNGAYGSHLPIESQFGTDLVQALTSVDVGASGGRSVFFAIRYFGNLLPGTAAELAQPPVGTIGLVRVDVEMTGLVPTWGARLTSTSGVFPTALAGRDGSGLVALATDFNGDLTQLSATTATPDAGLPDAGAGVGQASSAGNFDGLVALYDADTGEALGVARTGGRDLWGVTFVDDVTVGAAGRISNVEGFEPPGSDAGPFFTTAGFAQGFFLARLDVSSPPTLSAADWQLASGEGGLVVYDLEAAHDGALWLAHFNGQTATFDGLRGYTGVLPFAALWRAVEGDKEPPMLADAGG